MIKQALGPFATEMDRFRTEKSYHCKEQASQRPFLRVEEVISGRCIRNRDHEGDPS